MAKTYYMGGEQIPEILGFEGHIVLYCKWNYKTDTDFLLGLRRIWCVRCGLSVDNANNGAMDCYIANALFEIREKLGYSHPKPHELLHAALTKPIFFKHEEGTPIEKIIRLYVSDIQGMSVRRKEGNTWVWIVKLPKPNKRVMNRILRGNGRYTDYELLTSKK